MVDRVDALYTQTVYCFQEHTYRQNLGQYHTPNVETPKRIFKISRGARVCVQIVDDMKENREDQTIVEVTSH